MLSSEPRKNDSSKPTEPENASKDINSPATHEHTNKDVQSLKKEDQDQVCPTLSSQTLRNDANDNSENMYRYSPLARPGSIRLLRLMAHTDENARIECQLFDYPLQELGEGTHLYEALSYVWGDPENLRSIFINQHDFPITKNLYSALLYLRDRFIDRIIWVDALCIHQNDNEEKGQQILFMAEIYSKASRVIVWLGEAEKDSDRALEQIHLAADDTSTKPLVDELNKQAIRTLLQRSWFKRIWVRVLTQVLPEVAAARNILIKCGSTEIGGYAFCAALNSRSFDFLYEDSPKLRSLIRSVTYLITGAVFRRKKVSRSSGTFSLRIRPLGELIEMYHDREASKRHDKVFALLGMSSDDSISADLLPDYEIPWERLLERVVRFLLGGQVSVKTWAEKEMAVIKSKGCILGRVSSVQSSVTWDGRRDVDVILKNILGKSGCLGERSSHWTLQASAKSIKIGDVICLLQGASKPTIVRLREDHCTILLIAATPRQIIQNESGFVEWSNNQQLVNLLHTRNFQLLWDWENSPEKLQDKATRSWNFAFVLGDVGEYKQAEEKFREAMKGYETVFGKE
ncbi:HET-domain-containing protein, partial [Lepidopterella palustris CBS 459.81]